MSFTAAYVVAAACLGYVFCLKCYKFRYSLARKSGYYSYLYCTSFGIIFLLTGSVIGIKVFGVDALRPIELVGTGGSLNVLAANVLAGSIVAFCSVVFFNTVTEKKTAIALAWVDDLSVMLNKAIALELPVQVSLDNRKVYIGFVFDTLEPDEESSYLSILPVMSGYRDKDTLDLVITQKYEKIIDLLNINDTSSEDESSYQLVIPKERIVTSHIFDIDIYNQTLRDRLVGGHQDSTDSP